MEKTTQHRPFELDRIIFFSDAVFAIAITLLVLEIKFPTLKISEGTQIFDAPLQSFVIHFGAFVLSFFFISSMWYRHLQLFRLLRNFDTRLVVYNLIFMFFIVCFPLILSGLADNANKMYFLPMALYLINISLSIFAHFILCRYSLVNKPEFTVAGMTHQKKYMLLQAQYTAIIFIITLLVAFFTYWLSDGNIKSVLISVYFLPIFILIMKRRLKPYKQMALEERRKE